MNKRNHFAKWRIYTQGLKKIYGAAFSGCEKVWVVDAETFAFRPFDLRKLAEAYWRRPVVATIEKPRHYYTQLDIAALLRLDDKTRDALVENVYRAEDYWMYDSSSVRAMMKYVRRAHGARDFLDVYRKRPAMEYAIYAYEQHRRPS